MSEEKSIDVRCKPDDIVYAKVCSSITKLLNYRPLSIINRMCEIPSSHSIHFQFIQFVKSAILNIVQILFIIIYVGAVFMVYPG